MAIQLTVMSLDLDVFEEPTTKVYEKNEVTFGRMPSNDVVLDRPEVSAFHARLRLREDGGSEPALYITDLGSSMGTMVENMSLRPDVEEPMLPNQRIIIGTYLIKPSIFHGTAEDVETERVPEEEAPAGRSKRGRGRRPSEPAEAPAMQASEAMMLEYPESGHSSSSADFDTFEDAEQVDDDDDVPIVVGRRPSEHGTAREEMPEVPRKSGLNGGGAYAAEQPSERAAEKPSTSPSGEYVLPSSSTEPVAIEVTNDISVDFSATELFDIEGRVLHKGQGLAGVEINAGQIGRATTTADGSFRFEDLPEGARYAVSAEKDRFIFELERATGRVEGPVDIAITATELFSVAGTVLHKGAPLAGVLVRAGDLGERTTDSSGRFEFEDVPEGTPYRVTVEKDQFLFSDGERSGEVPAGGAALEFASVQLFTIRGTISHKGRPMRGVTVDAGELGTFVTGSDGEYRFENVPEGTRYSLIASKGGFVFGRISG